MKTKVIILAACIAAVIALALPLQAEALQAARYYHGCNVPVVSEVVTNGEQYTATIEVKASKVLVYQGKHKVHVDRIGKTVWMLGIKKNKTYTIKAIKDGKRHVIKWKLVK